MIEVERARQTVRWTAMVVFAACLVLALADAVPMRQLTLVSAMTLLFTGAFFLGIHVGTSRQR